MDKLGIHSQKVLFYSNFQQIELRLRFEWTKVNSKCQKWSILASFWEPEACAQTVLPDRSVLIGQKLVKMPKFKCDILDNFQTLCTCCPTRILALN